MASHDDSLCTSGAVWHPDKDAFYVCRLTQILLADLSCLQRTGYFPNCNCFGMVREWIDKCCFTPCQPWRILSGRNKMYWCPRTNILIYCWWHCSMFTSWEVCGITWSWMNWEGTNLVQVEVLSAGIACKVMFWPIPGVERRNLAALGSHQGAECLWPRYPTARRYNVRLTGGP